MIRLASIFAAARLLGISSQELAQLVRDDAIPRVELPGGQIRFDVRDLDDWTESLKQPPRTTEAVTFH